MIYSGNQEVRRVYLDVPHTANPKPSWYGESVGYYEGDALVIDTIGQNDKTFIDNYRTPHTEKIHVVERWRLIDGGKMLEVNVRIEDPDTFKEPWSAIQRYRRVQQPTSGGPTASRQMPKEPASAHAANASTTRKHGHIQ
jgi:hypothetical protein